MSSNIYEHASTRATDAPPNANSYTASMAFRYEELTHQTVYFINRWGILAA